MHDSQTEQAVSDTDRPRTDPPQPDRHTIIVIDNRAFRNGIKLGFLVYLGVHAFAILIGILCVGAMLLVGYILAVLR